MPRLAVVAGDWRWCGLTIDDESVSGGGERDDDATRIVMSYVPQGQFQEDKKMGFGEYTSGCTPALPHAVAS
jgi:hypothetical protein